MKIVKDFISKISNKLEISHPRKKFLYAITGGVYLGEMFVLMEDLKKDKNYLFLSLPDFQVRTVSYEKFEFGLTNKIIDIVEKLPSHVYSTCEAKYNSIKSDSYVLNKSVSVNKSIFRRRIVG